MVNKMTANARSPKVKSKSSRRWLARQEADPYTKQAKKQGFRSRAAFKLIEIQKRDQILKQGMRVVDLGAAPGGWSQVAAEYVGHKGQIIALDKLAMDPLPGVDIILGDFQEEAVYQQLLTALEGQTVDLLLCDMAPNISGIAAIDQPRSIYLAELALSLAEKVLKTGGSFLVKVFQGQGSDEYSSMLKRQFKQIVIRKPQSSRSESREVYFLAKGFIRDI
jgi:23S rRNA (uridine2552-2'-O)-methyltransferase